MNSPKDQKLLALSQALQALRLRVIERGEQLIHDWSFDQQSEFLPSARNLAHAIALQELDIAPLDGIGSSAYGPSSQAAE